MKFLCSTLMVLLLASPPLSAKGNSLIVSRAKQVVGWPATLQKRSWHRQVAGAILAGGLLYGGIVSAQEEDVNADWQAVNAQSPEVYRSVFYLKVADVVPPTDDAEIVIDDLVNDLEQQGLQVDNPPEIENHLHHVIYLGKNPTGEPLFAGLYLAGHEESQVDLYSHQGLVRENIVDTDVAFFDDPAFSYSEITVFSVAGLEIDEAVYQPIKVAGYPLTEIGKELTMLAYGVADDAESFLNLPLWQRRCQVADSLGWAKIGTGLHTCQPPEANHSSFGAPIFDLETGMMIAFNAGKSKSGWFAEGTHEDFVAYVSELQGVVTAVDPLDKVVTTWGKIKMSTRQ